MTINAGRATVLKTVERLFSRAPGCPSRVPASSNLEISRPRRRRADPASFPVWQQISGRPLAWHGPSWGCSNNHCIRARDRSGIRSQLNHGLFPLTGPDHCLDLLRRASQAIGNSNYANCCLTYHSKLRATLDSTVAEAG